MMNSENFAHNFIDSFMNVDQTVFVPFIMMQLKIFGQKFQIRRAVFFWMDVDFDLWTERVKWNSPPKKNMKWNWKSGNSSLFLFDIKDNEIFIGAMF